MSEKRGAEELPAFEDPQDLVNAVVSTLQVPEEKTNVAMTYANDKNVASEVQAYAKIAGRDWTYYVKSLAISIGRNTENVPSQPSSSQGQVVQIDLGPAKVVSRQHAAITYNIDLRCWELKVLGRNGARIDGVKMPVGQNSATPLHSGAILDVGGTQMMFILPDTPPSISQKMLSSCLSRYKGKMAKLGAPNHINNSGPNGGLNNNNGSTASSTSTSTNNGTNNGVNGSTNSANGSTSTNYSRFSNGFVSQTAHGSLGPMFDKNSLSQSPSRAAVSLQNNLDQDLSSEKAKGIKPPYSYATMITQAILSDPEGVMSLSEIYEWISSHYAYYKYSKAGWQNSIRHNLSLNKAFEKVPRKPNEPGKGMMWKIAESYKTEFLKKVQTGTLSKSRRGSSVSRTLQIHLATHQALPDPGKNSIKTESHSRNGSMENPQLMQYTVPMNTYMPQQMYQQTYYGYNMGNQMQGGQMQGQMQGNQMGNQVQGGQMQGNQSLQMNQSIQGQIQGMGNQTQNHQMNGSMNGQISVQGQGQGQINAQGQMNGQMNGQGQGQGQGQVQGQVQGQGQGQGQVQGQGQGQVQVQGQGQGQRMGMIYPNQSLSQPLSQTQKTMAPSTLMPPKEPIELASPLRHIPSLDSAAKQKASASGNVFGQPQGRTYSMYKLPSYESAETPANRNSFSNTSNGQNTSESMLHNSTAPTTSNTSELGLGFTSPKKIAPLEAFTPERGSKAFSGNGKSLNANQSSPAFWNFVQFSTPNGQTPGRRISDDGQGSPTLSRGNDKIELYDDSPSASNTLRQEKKAVE